MIQSYYLEFFQYKQYFRALLKFKRTKQGSLHSKISQLVNVQLISTLYESKKLQKQPSEAAMQKGVLRNLAKYTGKHMYQGLFFNKIAGLRPAALLKKRL